MAGYEQQRYVIADASLAAGHLFVVGPDGDDNPRALLEGAVVVNPGTVDLRVGHSLTGVLGSRYTTVLAGTSRPLEGALDNVCVYNPDAATAGVWDLDAASCGRNSDGRAGIEHVGYRGATDLPYANLRYRVARLVGVAGADTDFDLYLGGGGVAAIASIKLYSVVVPTGATLNFTAKNQAGDSLLNATFNLETLVTKTLTGLTLTGTTSRLAIGRGERVRLTFSSSAGGDTVGDVLVEIAYRA